MTARPIGILARTAAVTELLARYGPLAPADIAERTGMPRASVYRLVEALGAIGMTETRPGNQTALSLRWLRLSDAASTAMSEWAGADDVLADLARRTGQTVFLSVPRPTEALCIRWAQGSGIGVLILRPGRSLPLHAGAAGRMCLAHRHDVDQVLREAPFERFTSKTMTTAEELLADVATTRSAGFTVSDQDVTYGISALAAPVIDAEGELAAAVSMGGLAHDIDQEQARFVDALLDTADRLTKNFNQTRT